MHGNFKEVLPVEAPDPLEKYAVTISYHDTHFHYNVITSRSVTGVLNFVNKNSSE